MEVLCDRSSKYVDCPGQNIKQSVTTMKWITQEIGYIMLGESNKYTSFIVIGQKRMWKDNRHYTLFETL
jgi:hypothetical protein